MSISASDLQKLVDICLKELVLIDIIINVKNSSCMRVGKDIMKLLVRLQLIIVPSIGKELKYLGLEFVSASRLKRNMQILRQKFFSASNRIFGNNWNL